MEEIEAKVAVPYDTNSNSNYSFNSINITNMAQVNIELKKLTVRLVDWLVLLMLESLVLSSSH